MKPKFLLEAALTAMLVWPASAHAQGASKELTIVLPDPLEVAEPCMSARASVGRVIKQNVVETLTEIDPTTGAVLPRLALSWERIDDKTWRIKLREGVKFHDGKDFNADAVVFSINRTMDKAIPCVNRNKYFGNAKLTAKAVDAHTVEIVTDPVQPILPTLLGNLAIFSPNTTLGKHTREPIGTGPYVFRSWDPNAHVVLERFDGYWGGAPEAVKVTYVWRAESAVRAAMVTTREADIAPTIAVQDAADPATDSSYLNAETLSVQMTADLAPLNDIRIRKALNLAIDRQAFVGTLFSKDVLPATQLVIPSIKGNNPEIKAYPYDPAQARALIAAAKADGVPVDTEITFAGTGYFPNATEVVEALAHMWQSVGLNVKPQMMEGAQYNDVRTKPYKEGRKPTLFLDSHDNNSGDAAITVFFKYHSNGAHSNIYNQKLDKIIDSASAATGDERTKLYQQALKMVHDEIVADIVLFHLVGYARVSPKLAFKPAVATNSELQLSQVKFKN